jgi:hypothetical protein
MTNDMKRAKLRDAVTRRDVLAALATLPALSDAELAETVRQRNENKLAYVFEAEGTTLEKQGVIRASVGDLSKCWLMDGDDGLSVTRDQALVQFLADAYRLQLLLDSEGERIN